MAATAIGCAESRVFEFTLGDSPDVHSIPIAAYLPFGFVKRVLPLGNTAFGIELIHEFCPELEDDPSVNLETVKAILDAWNSASDADGASAGESQASPGR